MVTQTAMYYSTFPGYEVLSTRRLLGIEGTILGTKDGSKYWYEQLPTGIGATLTLLLQVGSLFLVDTLNSVFNIGLVWRYTITLFGKLA
jgi:hypothetical protein